VVDEEEEEEAAEEESLLSLSTKLSYGAPQFATMSLTFLINVYGNRFYAQMGAQLSALAFFTALARSLDVITDPFMGWFSDNTRTSYGRRRPFVFFGCPFYGVFFILLMSPPDGMGEEGIAMWFGLFYVCFYLSDTLSNIPYYGANSRPNSRPNSRHFNPNSCHFSPRPRANPELRGPLAALLRGEALLFHRDAVRRHGPAHALNHAPC
jgi:Na+/melibiose symporter-like transporter